MIRFGKAATGVRTGRLIAGRFACFDRPAVVPRCDRLTERRPALRPAFTCEGSVGWTGCADLLVVSLPPNPFGSASRGTSTASVRKLEHSIPPNLRGRAADNLADFRPARTVARSATQSNDSCRAKRARFERQRAIGAVRRCTLSRRWLRFVAGARSPMEHFRVSRTLATIRVGFVSPTARLPSPSPARPPMHRGSRPPLRAGARPMIRARADSRAAEARESFADVTRSRSSSGISSLHRSSGRTMCAPLSLTRARFASRSRTTKPPILEKSPEITQNNLSFAGILVTPFARFVRKSGPTFERPGAFPETDVESRADPPGRSKGSGDQRGRESLIWTTTTPDPFDFPAS